MPYLNAYGRAENYYFRGLVETLSATEFRYTTDRMISLRIVRDWAASENLRYIAFQGFGDSSAFDVTGSIPVGTADAPVPLPARNFPDYFAPSRLSFSAFKMPPLESLSNTISGSDPLDFYPPEVVNRFGKSTVQPIQMNIWNFRQAESSAATPYLRSYRRAFIQPAIEFDILTDPTFQNPRIVPVVVNGRVDPPTPFPDLTYHTTSFQAFPYQQLAP